MNEGGEILTKDSIEEELMGKTYASVVIKTFEKEGCPMALVSTKNDRSETVNMKEFNTYASQAGNKLISDFKQKSNGENSYDNSSDRKSLNGKTVTLKPVVYNNKFF